jgi:hypothetical protein
MNCAIVPAMVHTIEQWNGQSGRFSWRPRSQYADLFCGEHAKGLSRQFPLHTLKVELDQRRGLDTF